MDTAKQQTIIQKMEKFFSEYETRFMRSLLDPPQIDIEGTVDSFASSFIGANPSGVACGKNDAEFRTAMLRGFAFYKSIGTKSMKIASLDIQLLDDCHVMVKVHWDSSYYKDNREIRIEFDVIYFPQIIGDTPKVFAYITGDEQKTLREHGLIPG
jgi:hypothetical protein